GLDDMIAKAGKADEPKLSKKQLKKLKNNKGQAVGVQDEVKNAPSPGKADKKVQFAKNLEQGPTGSAEKAKPQDNGKKASLGKEVGAGRHQRRADFWEGPAGQGRGKGQAALHGKAREREGV